MALVATAALTLGARTAQGPSIWENNKDAVLLVHAVGHLFNGTTEEEYGSGFFVADSLALTANHVVFETRSNYRTIDVSVRLPAAATAVPAAVIDVDAANDVALLRVTAPSPTSRVAVGAPAASPIGADLDVIGYPLQLEESFVSGSLSSKPKPNSWRMTAPVNPGNSGGPVFDDASGRAIGLVQGGITKVTQPDGTTYLVEGIKYFVPLNVYKMPSTILKNNARMHDTDSEQMLTEFGELAAPPPPRPPPDMISRSYEVSFEKTDHPIVLAPSAGDAVASFDAEPGYRITSISGVSTISANHAGAPSILISGDGRKATVRVRLTSGPFIDQYRAWFVATIGTKQSVLPR